MAMKRMLASLLVATLVAAGVIGASVLAPREAGASLVKVKTCGGGTIELNAYEKRVLEFHNRTRTKHGLKTLCVNVALTKAARAHSQEMLDKDYASHTSFNGETIKQRLTRFGYTSSGCTYYLIGENIAWGCGSRGAPDHIFKWWMNSKYHRSNILNKNFREVGIGVRGGKFKTCKQARTYTVDFGTRRR
jgi:uncharacterized protein YkwD